MILRRFFIIGALSFVAFWFLFFWVISLAGPSYITRKAAAKGFDLSIEKVHTNYLHRITLHNIELRKPVEGHISRARFSFRPWEFFKTGGQIFFLDLKEPRLRISSFAAVGREGPSRPFLFRLRVRTADGEIYASLGKKQIAFTNVNGFVNVGPLGIFGHLNGSVDDAGTAAVHLSVPSILKSWSARVISDSIDVGRLVGDFVERQDIRQRIANLGKVSLDAEINAERLKIKFVHFLNGCDLSGTVRFPWNDPRLELKISSQRTPVEGFLAAFAPDSTASLAGDLSFDAKVEGTIRHPNISGAFSTKISAGKILFPELAGRFSYDDGFLTSSSTFSSGLIRVANAAKDSSTYLVSVRKLDLAGLARENGWKNVHGLLDTNLSWDSRESAAGLKGRFELTGFQWGRIKSDKSKSGNVELTSKLLNIQTDDSSFGVRGHFTAKNAKLDDFHFRFGTESDVRMSGIADFESRNLSMSVMGSKIPPDLWPPLVAQYPDIQGSLDFSGDVAGSIESPQAELDLSFNRLKFLLPGNEWNGSAQLIGDKNHFALKSIKVDGGYTGELMWEKGVLSFIGDLKEASPALIRDVMKQTTPVSGSITGPLNVGWNGSHLTATADVAWSNGLIDQFAFDTLAGKIDFKEDVWTLTQAELIKAGSAVRLEAQGRSIAEGWKYDATVQLQQWGRAPLVMDGEILSAGTITKNLDLSGSLNAPTLWIQNNPLENFSAAVRKSGDAWTLKGTSGREISFQFALNQKSKSLQGAVNATSLPIGSWFDAFLSNTDPEDKLTGLMDLQGRLSGTMDKPEMHIDARLKNGLWKGQSFHSDISMIADSSGLTVKPSIVKFSSGGRVTMSGGIEGEAVKKIAFEGRGEDVALDTLFGLMNWSLRLDGRADFSFDFYQQGSSQTINVDVRGTHDGIGLFKRPGEIHGTISGNLKELDLSGFRITSGGGYVRLLNGSRAFLEKGGSGRLRLPIEARNLSAGLLVFFGNVDIAGSWEGKSVPEEDRATSLDVFARSLWVNQYYLDGNITRLTLKKGKVGFSPIPGSGQQLSGELLFKDYPKIQVNKFRLSERGTEKVFLDGEIGRGVWAYKLELRGIDAGLISSLMDKTIPISGPMDISAQANGTYDAPRLRADVHWKNGLIYGVPVDSAEGVVDYNDGVVTIDKIVAKKDDGYELTGYIRPDEIDFRIKDGDLEILTEMTPEVSKAKGSFEGSVQSKLVNGRWKNSGHISAQKMTLRTNHVPTIENGVIELSMKDDQLKIIQARMDSGAGRIVCEGKIDFDGLRPTFFDLKLKTPGGKGILVRVPELAIKPGPVLGRLGSWGRKLAGISQGEANIDLTFRGPADAPDVTGEINFLKTTFTYPPTKSKQSQPTAFSRWVRGYLADITWDVTLNALSRAWFQNELVNAALTGKIRFSGRLGMLDINGRFDSEQGSIVYSGNEFSIKQATLEIETKEDQFESEKTEKKNYVYLRAVAEREVFYSDSLSNNNQDTIVMVVDRSLIGEIQPRFYSKNNPNLSSQKALQLALGLPLTGSIEEGVLLPDQRAAEQERSRVENDKFLRAGLIQLLDSSLASPLARALAQNTGLVDFVRVTYQDHDPLARDEFDPSGESTNDVTQNEFLKYAKGTKVKFGRGISRRLFADYSFRVDEYQERIDLRHEVELAYRLKQSLFLRGITELDSERTLGRPPDRRAILENQWRFGLPRKKTPKTN